MNRTIRHLVSLYVVLSGVLPDEPRYLFTIFITSLLLAKHWYAVEPVMRRIWPMLALILLSCVMTVSSGVSGFNIIKGIWYITRPAVYIGCGFLVAVEYKDPKALLRLLLICGVLSSVQYSIRYFTDPNVAGESRTYVRRVIGKGNYLMSIALVAGVLSTYYGRAFIRVPRIISLGCVFLCLIAVVVSESRSLVLVFLLMLPVTAAFVPRSVFGKLLVPGLIVAEFFLTTPAFTYLLGESFVSRFVTQAPDFLNEMMAIDRQSLIDINDYWRGFETFWSYTFVNERGFLAQLLGTGLGTQVPIPIAIKLDTEIFTSIPVFHNGFSFMYVRSGVAGVMLYVIQCGMLAGAAARLSRQAGVFGVFGAMSIGLSIVACLTTPTTAGLFNYSGSLALILGMSSGYECVVRMRKRIERQQELRSLELQTATEPSS